VPIATKLETVCVGRHLIDMPVGFAPVMPLAAIFKSGDRDDDASPLNLNILGDGTTIDSFEATVQKRRGEIVAFSDDSTDILKEVITKGRSATLFRIMQVKESYMSELHLLNGDLHLTAKMESYYGRFNEAETTLFSFANKISLANEKPDRRIGFCLGPIAVLGLYKTESARVTFRSDLQPDILISVDIDTYGWDDPITLFQRVSGPNSLLQKFDVRNNVLRKRELEVAGMHAQEWLGSVKLGENRDKKQFGFALETRRPNPGQTAPRLHIELDTGQNDRNGTKHQNSMTDEQAIVLWDSIISSIRAR